MSKTLRSIDLHYQDNRSDKVYHLAIIDEYETSTFRVLFAYGRRGSTLKFGEKYAGANLVAAEKIYWKIESEKRSEGYLTAPGVSGQVFPPVISAANTATPPQQTPQPPPPEVMVIRRLNEKEPTGILPQLLNPITEDEIETYIHNSNWGMQQKMDGTRLIVERAKDGIRFINRKGFEIPVVHEIAEAVFSLGVECCLDGEAIGNVFYVFDCLSIEGKDIRQNSFKDRYAAVSRLITKQGKNLSKHISLVLLATTVGSKQRLLQMVRDAKGEGVVFKNLDAPCIEGRPNSGGTQLKAKFWASASCVVQGVKEGKRSVSLGLVDPLKSNIPGGVWKIVDVGYVTIPANHEIPEPGQVVEIKYLYAYRGGSLYQPIYLGVRTDINTDECVLSQLKYKPENSEEDN